MISGGNSYRIADNSHNSIIQNLQNFKNNTSETQIYQYFNSKFFCLSQASSFSILEPYYIPGTVLVLHICYLILFSLQFFLSTQESSSLRQEKKRVVVNWEIELRYLLQNISFVILPEISPLNPTPRFEDFSLQLKLQSNKTEVSQILEAQI